MEINIGNDLVKQLDKNIEKEKGVFGKIIGECPKPDVTFFTDSVYGRVLVAFRIEKPFGRIDDILFCFQTGLIHNFMLTHRSMYYKNRKYKFKYDIDG